MENVYVLFQDAEYVKGGIIVIFPICSYLDPGKPHGVLRGMGKVSLDMRGAGAVSVPDAHGVWKK